MKKEDIVRMQIKRIEKEIRDTPYHKGTEHHIGRLRAKLSKLKDSQEKKSGKGGGVGYAVKKQGDATIVLVGPPSAGKSTLLNKLTNAKSKIAPYEFTTVTVIPGMMDYNHAKIQILDVPGLIEGAEEGKGRGREVLSVVRGSDLLIIMTDQRRINSFKTISEALYNNGIRINQNPPDVLVKKKTKGAIVIHSNIKQELDKKTIKEVAREFGYTNTEIEIKEKLTMETLIDSFAKNRVYIPAIFVLNKIDLKQKPKSVHYRDVYDGELIKISSTKETNLDVFKKEIWNRLALCVVYLVRGDEKPSKKNPMVVSSKDTLNSVLESIGEEFAEGKTKAKIWGSGAVFAGQRVSLNKKVVDGMQVRFV